MSSFNKMKNDMQFKQGRLSLLAIVIFSTINLFSIIFSDFYILFSSYFTNIFAFIGYDGYVSNDMTFMGVAIVLGLISVLPYLICFLFAKKHVGWLIGALVLFSIDSVFLLFDFIICLMAGDFSMIIDVAFHAYAIYALVIAVKYGFKVKADKESPDAAPETETLTYSEDMANTTRNLVIERKKAFTSIGTVLICYIDGKEVCRLKNGASTTIAIDGNPHKLDVLEPQSYKSASAVIREGYGTKNVLLTCKAAYRGVTPFIEMN